MAKVIKIAEKIKTTISRSWTILKTMARENKTQIILAMERSKMIRLFLSILLIYFFQLTN
ncbi:TPA: hypothetical protein DCL92_02090 [Candidatus Collierbacteria bacterium]|nr:hypothetical protein [Candidatus Collierbacteria bacterium]